MRGRCAKEIGQVRNEHSEQTPEVESGGAVQDHGSAPWCWALWYLVRRMRFWIRVCSTAEVTQEGVTTIHGGCFGERCELVGGHYSNEGRIHLNASNFADKA